MPEKGITQWTDAYLRAVWTAVLRRRNENTPFGRDVRAEMIRRGFIKER
jgi:hypothetical protein